MADMGQFLLLLLLAAQCTASPRVKRLITESEDDVKWEENVPDYPEHDAEMLFAELKNQNKLMYFVDREYSTLENRLNTNENLAYTNLCNSTKKNFFPRAVTVGGIKYFVLNPSSHLLQSIDTEVCNENRTANNNSNIGYEGQACLLVENVEDGYITKCVQEHITRVTYLMSNDVPRKLITQVLQINSCCSCSIEIDFV